MDTSVVLLDSPTRDSFAVCVLDWVIDPGWLIKSYQSDICGLFFLLLLVFFVSNILPGLFLTPGCLCLWLVGSGESRSQQHTRLHTVHTPTGRRARILEQYLPHEMNSEDYRRRRRRKSTMVKADAKPALSLSNGIDDVSLYFHLDTILTHDKGKKMQLRKSNQ